MKFLSDIRLLLLGLWLGAACFFIAVAASAFAVLPQRELAGAVVNRTLAILNYAGLGTAIVLLLTSLIVRPGLNRAMLWVERILLFLLAAATAIGQFVFGWWLLLLRTQMGRPVDDVPLEDPLRIQFNQLHEYSTWTLFVAMTAALLAFFVIANRRYGTAKKAATPATEFDFKKEFKI